MRPLAQRDPVPRGKCGVEVARIVDPEVGQPGTDPRLVHRAVPAMAAGELDVRLEPGLDELGIRLAPAEAGEHADMPALDEAEASGATRDLRELPRQERPSRLAVELRRLGEQKRLAREVHAVPEDIGRDAYLRGPGEEAVDLLAPGGQRHRAVEHRDLARMPPVHLACEREHGTAAERDDDGARRQRLQRPLADEVQGQLSLEDLELGLRERSIDERKRVERAEQQDLPVLAAEQEARPRGAALLVVRPLHLVEHEQLAGLRRHLDGRGDDRSALVDPLLARDEADLLGTHALAETAMRLLGEHPQRAGIDAAARRGELLQSGVRLPGVRRPEVRDDALGLDYTRREGDLDPALGALRRLPRLARALRAARALLPSAMWPTLSHRPTVAAEPGTPGLRVRRGGTCGA